MEFQEMNNLKILHDEINEAKNMFENLKSKKNDIDKLTEDLNKYKTCLYNFKSLIDNKNSLNAKLIADEKQQSIFSTELSKLQIIHKELNSKFVEIEKDYKNIEVQKDETDDLKKILGILKLDKSISEIQYKLDKNIEFKTEAENKFNTINSKLDDIKSNIKTLEKNLPDLKLLSKIKEWFLIKQQIKDSIGELESNLKQRKDKIVQIEREKVNISCNKSMSDLNLDFSLNIVELISDLKYKNDWYQKNVKKLISERESLNLKFKLKEFSESLEDGMPCPVCGALSHPDPLKIENVNLQLEKLNGRIVNGERLVDEINSCVEVLQGLNSRLTNEQSNISEIENKLLEKKNQLIKHNDLFKWDDFDSHNPESVDVELSKADLISKQIKTFKSEEEKTSTLKESLSKSFDVLKQENLDLNLHFKTNIAEKNLLLSQLSVLKYEDFVTKDNFFVEEYLKNKLLFIDDLIKNHNTLEKDIKEKEKQITLNQIKLDSVLKKIEEYKLDINDNSKEIEIKLIKFGFANEDEVKKILSQDIDIENSEKTIKEYELNFYNATNQIEKLKIKIGARVFDEKNYYVLKEKIENLNTSLDDIQMKIGALSNEIKDWEEKIITKKRLTKEINKLELRISDIKTLLSMFKGNGFVNFVSKIKLRELVNYANSRFNKLTRGRLSLQLNANNSFEIIDYLNDGKKRNIKSLSGGQLFQASLSLALALAGIVQSQNKNKQNFFFLDEGFGTQDEQSLNLVFEAISSLRQENRVVGLISHVAEMKENIYAYLDIRNDESVGSLITASWEK
ncbi:MAG: SMC family ATPase [Saprospiraceae bacterium]